MTVKRPLRRMVTIAAATVIVVFLLSGCGRLGLRPRRTAGPGLRIELAVVPPPGRKVDATTMDDTIAAIEIRAAALTPYANAYPSGKNAILVNLPGFRDRKRALKLLGSQGALEFYWLRNVNDDASRGRKKLARYRMSITDNAYSFIDTKHPYAPITDPGAIRSLVIGRQTKPILTSADLVPGGARVTHDNQGGVLVALTFSQSGRRRFSEFTRTHVHEFLAITMDDRIITAPLIQEAIRGNPVIAGQQTVREAQDFADVLNSGQLPTRVRVVRVSPLPPGPAP